MSRDPEAGEGPAGVHSPLPEPGPLAAQAMLASAWSTVDAVGRRLVGLGVLLVLARVLAPADFGLVALATVVVALFQAILEQSFAEALVQRRELRRTHRDTAFWCNAVLGMAFAAIVYLAAGLLERWFGAPGLRPLLHWLAPSLVITSIAQVPHALLRRGLQFRLLAVRSLAAAVGGGAVAVGLALSGHGVWSLVAFYLVQSSVGLVALWAVSPWWPGTQVHVQSMRELFAYGSRTVGSQILSTLRWQVPLLAVGWALGSVALGAFVIAYRFFTVLWEVTIHTLMVVSFPVFSRLQHDGQRLSRYFRAFTVNALVLTAPLFVGLAVLAPEAVRLLAGPQWPQSGALLAVLAWAGPAVAATAFTGPLLRGVGRPRGLFWLFASLSLLDLLLYAAALQGGLAVFTAVFVARAYAYVPLHWWAIRRAGVAGQAKLAADAARVAAVAAQMGLLVLLLRSLLGPGGTVLAVLLGVGAGAIAYLLLLRLEAASLVVDALALLRHSPPLLRLARALQGWASSLAWPLALARARRMAASGGDGDEGDLWVTPSPVPGSFGDEAMLTVGLQQALASGRPVTLLDLGAQPHPLPGLGEAGRLLRRARFRASHLDLDAHLQFVRMLRGHRRLFLLGADVLDGGYGPYVARRLLRFAALASRAGLEVRILGFSFNESPLPGLLRAWRRLPPGVQACLRDPASAQRFRRLTGRPCRDVADLAFLFDPKAGAGVPAAGAWAAARRAEGRTVVAITPCSEGESAQRPEQVAAAWGGVLAGLRARRPGCAFVLLPHDVRVAPGGVGEVDLCRMVLARLPPEVAPDAILAEVASAGEAKAVLGRVDLLASGRLHACIAALSQGVLAVGVPRQGKFEGVYSLLGLPELAAGPGELEEGAPLCARVEAALERRGELVERLGRALPKVRALALANLEDAAVRSPAG